MAFQARHFLHERPFKDVLIHGLIRDAQGRKMSKSLGNGIDPMEVIDQYGVDSLRFFLSTNSTPGQDMRYIPEKVEASWNFINKLWNASRFVLMNLPEGMTKDDIDLSTLSASDAWILNKLNLVLDHVTENMEKYEFALVGNELYSFVWDDFCSWYIELSKASLSSDDEAVRKGAQSTLLVMLSAIIRMLHPFMPFVTEEIYQKLPHDKESICLETWPEKLADLPEADIDGMDRLISVIQKIREVKMANDLKPSAPLDVEIRDLDGNVVPVNETQAMMLERLAKVTWKDSLEGDLSVQTVRGGTIYIPSSQLMDVEAERTKMNAERERLEKEVARSRGILSNQGFLAKAPKQKIEAEQKKLEDYEKQLNVVLARLKELA
jgi:valyl-tRNA synthetase